MKPVVISPVTDALSGMQIFLTKANAGELRRLAIRYRTSPAALAQLAIKQLLIKTKAGAAPCIMPSTLENAEEINCLSYEVDD